MMNRERGQSMTVQLYLSPEHDCPYLEGKRSRNLFVDPYRTHSMPLYEALIDQGFRRSGDSIYRPDCNGCDQCIPMRIPVNEFRPRRIQRRVWNRQQSLYQVIEQPTAFDPVQFELFQRYMLARHPDGGMEATSAEGYEQFLSSKWANSSNFAFYQEERLVAVAVTDILQQGLSAVYTFYDPELERNSLGVFCLLWQIEACKKRGLPWLYVGYWIPECRKMAYKKQYLPHQLFIDDHWVSVSNAG